MRKRNELIEFITKLLLDNHSEVQNLGLFNGKMGLSIFFFYLGRQYDNSKYYQYAENNIRQIYDRFCNTTIQTGFENGLAGICWGIEHLVQNKFLDGNTDEILSELDSKIFQFLTNQKEIAINIRTGLLGYGFYLFSRLDGKELKDPLDHDYLLKRLLIAVLNRLYDALEEDEDIFDEPSSFDITWNLPLMLLFLSKVKTLNVYDHKVKIIIDRLSYVVLSTLPLKYSNRLYFLLSIEKVLQQIQIKKWQEHALILKKSIEPNKLIKEFSDKNILLNKGSSGLTLILKMYNNILQKYQFDDLLKRFVAKAIKSDFWEDLEKKEKISSEHLGLFSGLAGLGFSLFVDTSFLNDESKM